MTSHLRARAVQDVIYAVIWYVAALAMYIAPSAPYWLYLVPVAACLWSIADLVRTVAERRRKQ